MSMDDLAQEIAEEHLGRWKIQNATYIYASCPFHEDKKPSFYINRESGAWGCWSCNSHGPDLAQLLKAIGVSSRKAKDVVEHAKREAKKNRAAKKAKAKIEAKKAFRGQCILPEDLLGVYDWTPTALVETFGEELLEDHQIGYDRKHNRITFPIRDVDGNLIGLSGRKSESDWGPKYKVYQGVHVNADGIRVPGELGEWFPEYSSDGIRDHLWRGDRVFWPTYHGESEDLIIVEGFKAALWLVHCGYYNTVALMGARMTPAQECLVRKIGTPTWVFLDNNDAGRSGSKDICWRLGNVNFPVYEVRYPVGAGAKAQPDDLDPETVDDCLRSAIKTYRTYKRSRQQQDNRRKAKR